MNSGLEHASSILSSDQDSASHPLVGAINETVRPIVIVINGAFVVLHAGVYMVGMNMFHNLKIEYIVMFLLELIPNFYVMGVVIVEYVQPEQRDLIQRILYYFKPVIEILGVVLLGVDLLPLAMGFFTWRFADGDLETDVGEDLTMQSLAVFVSYFLSMLIFWSMSEFIKRDLSIPFAGNMLSASQLLNDVHVAVSPVATSMLS